MVEYIIESVSPPAIEDKMDSPWWMEDTSGSFTVKSTFRMPRKKIGSTVD